MNCLRCNTELFDDKDSGQWIDKAWGEGVCYDADRQSHTQPDDSLNPPHLHPRDVWDKAVTELCTWINAQNDDTENLYTPDDYTIQTIRHVDRDAGLILGTLDMQDEGGPLEMVIWYDTFIADSHEFGSLRLLTFDFDLQLTILNFIGEDSQYRDARA